MEEEINDDEVLSVSQSSSTTRPSTAASSSSSDMPKVSLQTPRGSFMKRQSSNIDINDLSQSINKQIKDEIPLKVLVINGKCSEIFKSTLEDCVEDCILEFSEEKNSIYVNKFGQSIKVPIGSTRNSINSLREQSANARQSARSSRQRNSTNQFNTLPQIPSARSSLTTNYSLSTTALAVTAAARIRQQQKFSLAEDISEETTEQQTTIEQQQQPLNIEIEGQSKRPSISHHESISPNPNTSSLPLFSSTKTHSSYRNRQKGYRLSDLVMFGPEYFADVFNLPRNRSQSRQRKIKTTDKLTELDRIKQDLFHRYLWTQKPQVSCRIRPMSTYTRSSTFVV